MEPIQYKRNKIDASEIKQGVVFKILSDIDPQAFNWDGDTYVKAESVFLARKSPIEKDGRFYIECVAINMSINNGAFTLTPEQVKEWAENKEFNMNSVMLGFTKDERVQALSLDESMALMNDEPLKKLIPYVCPVTFKFEGDSTNIQLNGLVLEEEKRKAIISVLYAHSEDNQKLLGDTWGFNSTIEKGLGIAMLFWGPPGTGKTKCAEIMSEELGMKMVMVGPDMIWSSEPGGAERTIKEIFLKADPKTTLLLFDECDVLLCSRKHTGVILSASTNTLLQCMERYKGITVFTTNRAPVLDPAVERRLQLKLEFEKPPYSLQVQIWRTLIPPQCPLDDNVCFKTLAKSDLAGGHIKNVILNAARRAIFEKSPKVAMAHFDAALLDEMNGMAAFAEEDDTPWPMGGAQHVISEGGKMKRQIGPNKNA